MEPRGVRVDLVIGDLHHLQPKIIASGVRRVARLQLASGLELGHTVDVDSPRVARRILRPIPQMRGAPRLWSNRAVSSFNMG